MYYNAVVTDFDDRDLKSYLGGLITIRLRAYYPFARSNQMWIGHNDPNEKQLKLNTGMLTADQEDALPILSPIRIADNETLTEATSFYLYNPGTERADVCIEIAGDVGAGVTIRNETNGQEVKVIALNSTNHTGKHLMIDSLNGKVYFANDSDDSFDRYGYMYHDHGYLQLESAFPIWRPEWNNDDDICPCAEQLDDSFMYSDQIKDGSFGAVYDTDGVVQRATVKEYNTLNGLKVQYDSVDEGGTSPVIGEGTIGEMVPGDSSEPVYNDDYSIVGRFNKITVTPDTTMALTRLNFWYDPTFA